ncbi:MAG TPA: LLM class F420-dependent oxidoreductase [Acidimicrobiia bacterium]
MTIELGSYGIWQRTTDATPETARVVEDLGFGALWVGSSPDGHLQDIERILDGSESIPVATGIVNMWKADPATVAASYHRIEERHPGRFLLGVGIGHPEATSEYHSPYEVMVRYLDDLAGAGVPKENMVLAALGPKALRLSAEQTAGTHPYLTTPRHTRMAREILGDGPLVAPEQTVVVDADPDEANDLARRFVARYLRLVNYRKSLLREGWAEEDLNDGGSDRLVSELVLTGPPAEVAEGIRAHIEAGADHVCIQPLGSYPTAAYRALAEALL